MNGNILGKCTALMLTATVLAGPTALAADPPVAPRVSITAPKLSPAAAQALQRVKDQRPQLDAVLGNRQKRTLDALKAANTGELDKPLQDAATKHKFDTKAALATFRAYLGETDPAKKKELAAKVQADQLQIEKVVAAAQVNPDVRRTNLATSLKLLTPTGTFLTLSTGILSINAEGDDGSARAEPTTPPPPPPPPGPGTATVAAPFTLIDKSEKGSADPNGTISTHTLALGIGAKEDFASVGNMLHVNANYKRLAFSTVAQVPSYYVAAGAFFAYASAEAVLTLRVLEGSQVKCQDVVSLHRSIAYGIGGDVTGDRRASIPLRCEFHANPLGSDYAVLVELHTYAGLSAISAGAEANGTVQVQPIQVTLGR